MYWVVKTKWIIRAADWEEDDLGEFGPFAHYEEAERCVIALASRETIVSAVIVSCNSKSIKTWHEKTKNNAS